MRPLVFRLMLIFALVANWSAAPTLGQESEAPLVGFVVDSDLGTASHTDLGVTGLNRFAEMFRAYGAQVTAIDLSRAIPDEVDLVVIVGPVKSFTIPQVARLWIHLQKGKNLLLAVDPENYFVGNANINTQVARSGLTALLTLDYGILIRDAFLVEPWFTVESITRLETTYSRTFVDVVSHPVVAPLASFNVPVWVWGSRALTVEPFGVDSQAVPLLYNNDGYAETNPKVFRVVRGNRFENATEPLQENIGADYLGWINVAALGENTATGSRIVVLGDSEMLENAYGLAGSPEARLYPGNVLFAQNVAGWLLDIPTSRWLSLPPGFTWITIDGGGSEWPESASLVTDAVDPGVAAELDIQAVRAFHDDAYAYLFVETWERPTTDARLELALGGERAGGRVVIASDSVNFVSTPVEIASVTAGSDVAIRSGIELRIPLRFAVSGIDDICLRGGASADLGIADCLGQPVPVPAFNTRAPFDLGLARGLLVTVSNNIDVNMRSGPSTSTAVVTTIPNGTIFAALGRSEDGSWLRVNNAGFSGWLSSGLVAANGDIQSLPVLDADG